MTDSKTTPIRSSYDAVVVGARCAGAATAMQMARRGLRVLAVERGAYASDTLSTLALMRPAVLQLACWGLVDRLRSAGTPRVRTTSFHYGDEPVVEVAIESRDGVDALYAPRRTLLDRVLVDAARESGATVVHRTRVVDLIRTDDRITGVVIEDADRRTISVSTDLVVGADGVRSTVARSVDAGVEREADHATAAVYGYWKDDAQTGYHWYFRPGLSAGTIPTNDGLTLVFACVPASELARLRAGGEAGYREVLRATSPELDARLAETERVGRLWGFPGQKGYVRRSHGRGWALVGDAGYFKDPLTAHGMSDALRDAELLARSFAALGEPGLATYQEQRDSVSRRFFELTDRIASFQWDMPTVKRWHLELSREMNHEVEAMKAWQASERSAA